MHKISDQRFQELLDAFSQARVAVLGDFFLDLYISLDRALSELSLETNLEAFQAVGLKGQPGAAGVVTNNLVALGATASAIAYTGDDGNGYTLRKALQDRDVDTTYLLQSADRFTPTYTKPMMKEVDGPTIELNRMDIRNRTPLSKELEAALVNAVEEAAQTHDGILVTEQVADDGCGVLSPAIRDALAQAARQYPDKVFMVDSRHFTHCYRHVGLKVNFSEAVRAAGYLAPEQNLSVEGDRLATAQACQRLLTQPDGRPVFITLGSLGLSGTATGEEFFHPAYPVSGPVDIVGAGDSVLAGLGLSLCAGATPVEAAYIGNLVGSITIQQLGTTGIATQEMLLERHYQYQHD